jgi:class 3 adenylate cyclase/pimeloyl-ACP methyl ester carboxylesterase
MDYGDDDVPTRLLERWWGRSSSQVGSAGPAPAQSAPGHPSVAAEQSTASEAAVGGSAQIERSVRDRARQNERGAIGRARWSKLAALAGSHSGGARLAVVEVPSVRYVRSGGVNIAYMRWGQGSHVIVYTPPLASNVELVWESPEWTRAAVHVGEHAQCVMLDKRGVGLSDRVVDPPSLEDRVADTLAVMDAEGLDIVDVVGHSEGGGIAVALAALHPTRVRSMILTDAPAWGVPRGELAALADEDQPLPDELELKGRIRNLVRHWGSDDSVNLDLFAPRAAADPGIRRWYQRFERQSASPGAVLGFLRSMIDYDLRPLLGKVTVPTLVTQARGDRLVHVAEGRYLAQAIAGARYIEYDIDEHLWQFAPEWRRIEDDMLEFITGHRPPPAPQSAFATVLFSDIVDSTARAVSVGDTSWRCLLDRHDRLALDLITRRGGRIVKQTGDGLLATFNDPAAAVGAGYDFALQLAGDGLPIRAGLHAGVIEVRDDGDITGITVNIAARVQSRAAPNEVLVSETVRDLLLGSAFIFQDRGEHELKGLERPRRLYAVVAAAARMGPTSTGPRELGNAGPI